MKQFHHNSGWKKFCYFIEEITEFCKLRVNHDNLLEKCVGAGRGRCFVGDSKARGQLGQAVKGLSVAGCAVNKDAEDLRAREEREGRALPK